MAIVAGTEQSTIVVTGTFGATGIGTSRRAMPGAQISATLWGTFVGTVALNRSFDGGTTWVPCYTPSGAAISFTAPASIDVIQGPEVGVLYAFVCTAYTSGTVNYRLSA